MENLLIFAPFFMNFVILNMAQVDVSDPSSSNNWQSNPDPVIQNLKPYYDRDTWQQSHNDPFQDHLSDDSNIFDNELNINPFENELPNPPFKTPELTEGSFRPLNQEPVPVSQNGVNVVTLTNQQNLQPPNSQPTPVPLNLKQVPIQANPLQNQNQISALTTQTPVQVFTVTPKPTLPLPLLFSTANQVTPPKPAQPSPVLSNQIKPGQPLTLLQAQVNEAKPLTSGVKPSDSGLPLFVPAPSVISPNIETPKLQTTLSQTSPPMTTTSSTEKPLLIPQPSVLFPDQIKRVPLTNLPGVKATGVNPGQPLIISPPAVIAATHEKPLIPVALLNEPKPGQALTGPQLTIVNPVQEQLGSKPALTGLGSTAEKTGQPIVNPPISVISSNQDKLNQSTTTTQIVPIQSGPQLSPGKPIFSSPPLQEIKPLTLTQPVLANQPSDINLPSILKGLQQKEAQGVQIDTGLRGIPVSQENNPNKPITVPVQTDSSSLTLGEGNSLIVDSKTAVPTTKAPVTSSPTNNITSTQSTTLSTNSKEPVFVANNPNVAGNSKSPLVNFNSQPSNNFPFNQQNQQNFPNFQSGTGPSFNGPRPGQFVNPFNNFGGNSNFPNRFGNNDRNFGQQPNFNQPRFGFNQRR